MPRFVVDIGNSRFKLAPAGPDGRLGPVESWPVASMADWWPRCSSLAESSEESDWAVSSVNPAACQPLEDLLGREGSIRAHWFRSAADVPVRHLLNEPHTAGADRALGVLAATARRRSRGSLQVILCGTAVTVEVVDPSGTWARRGHPAGPPGSPRSALNRTDGALPLVEAPDEPAPLGRASTTPAIQAGLFWGVVGATREVLSRQAALLVDEPERVWSGGDAPWIARHVEGGTPRIVPDLVLEGLAEVGFRGQARP